MTEAGSKISSFVCVGCGTLVERKRQHRAKYCSLDCYRSSPRPSRKTGFQIKCAHCGKIKYITLSEKKDTNFCNKACHDAFQSRGKTTHSCKTCGKEFKWSPSRVVSQNPTYCSITCRNNCDEWRRSSYVAANLKQQHSKELNRLEVAGSEILISLAIPFSEQVLIAEKFTVDVVLTDKKIVIQWDGDYWHGYRAEHDDRPLDERQTKRALLDKSQDAYMRKCEYTVLRFWEHEVFKQPEKVREHISKAVQQFTT